MSDRSLAAWYRSFVLALAAVVLAATTAELWFSEHVESVVQLIPFGLTALGFAPTLLVMLSPSRGAVLALRGAAIVLALGALYGIYEHVSHNIGFELEIRPTASFADVFWDALYGASPLLAPGALALAAILAAAATYRHPALDRQHA